MYGVHLYCQPPREEKWLMISRNVLRLKSFTCQRGPRLQWKRLHLYFLMQMNGVTVSEFLVESIGTYWKSRKNLRQRCSKQHVRTAHWMIASNSKITEKSKVHVKSTRPYTNSSCYASQTALNIIVREKGGEAKLRIRNYRVLRVKSSNCCIVRIQCFWIAGERSQFHLPTVGTKIIPRPPLRKTVVEKVLANQIRDQLYVPTMSNYTAIDAWDRKSVV